MFERGDTEVVDRYVRADYIQHNPLAPDGAETLKNLGVAIHQQFPDAEYGIKRVISEGDLVLVHSNVVLTPGTRGTAVNGNDMFSTESWPRTERPGAAWLTAYNKQLVTKGFDQLLVRKDLSAVDRYWGPEYHQHNPTIADGVEGVKAGLAGTSRRSRS
ncbi:nuclear transport factor 2 family protein [Streptomyces sp. CA-251387]|uniref:nuclear transport factor 2 family protein n=1 Tax=Streptomyces sp. CA-251387 TaxID=3240064 RepID=UPI003D8D0866